MELNSKFVATKNKQKSVAKGPNHYIQYSRRTDINYHEIIP